MMGIPALGSEEEIANAAVSAATESTEAGKADLIGSPETFNAEGQTTWFLAEHSLFRSPYVGKK